MANSSARTRFIDTDAVVAAMGASDRSSRAPEGREAEASEPMSLRRWDGGKTDRLNEAHWKHAHGQPINADLHDNLKTLRARCCHEAANNPMVDGIINTYAVDLAGRAGPVLQVQSDNPAYSDALEAVWSQVWNSPDFNGQLSGADMIHQWVRLWFTKGEHLLQEVTLSEVPDNEVQWRVLNIDPERLDTDFGALGDPNVALGVRRTREGRPTGYQLRDEEPQGVFSLPTGKFTEYSADEMIHGYKITEPGQVRGYPWLAPALPVIADLRDFDVQILDAQRMAADLAVYFFTKHEDAIFKKYQGSTDIQRRTMSFVPPGYEPFQLDPKQPSTKYVEYRSERLREMGRSVSMPLMKILLGSEKHNFSSARMDHLNYARALEANQGWLEHGTLNRMVDAVAREAMLVKRRGRFILPDRPDLVQYAWTWPPLPAVDPIKEQMSQRLAIENGTLPFRDACAEGGRDEDKVIESRKRTNEKFVAAKLPPLPGPKNVAMEPGQEPAQQSTANPPKREVVNA